MQDRPEDSVLSIFNWQRCQDPRVKKMRRGITFLLNSEVFTPSRAILNNNDEVLSIWTITGRWGNKYDKIQISHKRGDVRIKHGYDRWCSVDMYFTSE
jgi:hypothetical protein